MSASLAAAYGRGMLDPVAVDPARLRDLATGLTNEADALRARRVDPPKPDAGRSTGELARATAHLLGGAQDLRKLCEYVAHNLIASAEAYEQADAAAAADLNRIVRGLPPERY